MLLALGVLAGWLVVRARRAAAARARTGRGIRSWCGASTLPLWIVLAGVTARARAAPPAICGRCRCSSRASGCSRFRRRASPAVRARLGRRARGRRDAVAARHRASCCASSSRCSAGCRSITPVWIYAALMLACGAMVVPPFIAAVAATRPLRAAVARRPPRCSSRCVVTAGLAYAAPAYTYDAAAAALPARADRAGAATATYEVGVAGAGPRSRHRRAGGLVSRDRRAAGQPCRSARFALAVRVPHDRAVAGAGAGDR